MESNVVQLTLLPESNRLSHLQASRLSETEQEIVIQLALEALRSRFLPGARIDQPDRVRDYLQLQFAEREHEVFALLLLNQRHRVLDLVELFRGTIDGCSVHPREVVKLTLQRNAAAVILVHNHPSGAPRSAYVKRNFGCSANRS